MDQYAFGIDVGGTSVKCGLFTLEGKLLEKWEIDTRKANKGEAIPSDIADTVLAKIAERGLSKEACRGMGIGVPGPVTKDGVVHRCANIGWDETNIKQRMETLTGIPCEAGNDANVAALGEMWQGGGKGYTDVCLVTLGTGVGGGIIVNGQIITGSNGAGGEIGHMIVNPAETDICGCGGHGHLEQYASATGVVRLVRKALATGEFAHSSLAGIEASKLTAKDIIDAAKAGDELGRDTVDALGRYLALALSHVAATVDPQVFVFGGGVSKAGEILIEAVTKYYNDNILTALQGKEFRLARLGNDAGIFGCAKLVIGA